MADLPIAANELITFQDALARAQGKKHLFLGNGFSRACRNDIFAYDALFTRADFRNLSQVARRAFDVLGTKDFEVVMRALRTASLLAQLYAPDNPALARVLFEDADGLREVLASAIAQNHPDRPSDIQDEAYAACRRFLANFETFYTVNYDLLLYWAFMHDEFEPDIKCDDGFRTPDEPGLEYVTWDVEKTDRQNVFYLHGALHVYDADAELKKFTWINTGIRLIDQIRNALAENMFPLIVAEGTSREKMTRILHSNYLGRGYRSFAKIAGSLFAYGHAMSENDEHWASLIAKNKVRQLFVGIHGDPNSAGNRNLIARCREIQMRRPRRQPLDVAFFDASTAHVWG